MKLKNRNLYYFFRSFFISSAVISMLISFLFCICVVWQRMQYTSFGVKDAKPIEITDKGLRILDFYI